MQPIERMLLINYRFWWHRIRASILYVCEVRSVEYELESAVECEFKKFYFYLHNFLFQNIWSGARASNTNVLFYES